jgi:RHS repeat-associated protein
MAMTVRYTTINGEIIAEKRSGVRKQYVPDPLGSTVALLDNTQTQTDTFTYWPYGEVRTRTGTTATPFQYVGTAGCHQDSSSRTYIRARVLDVVTGQWLTQDPIGFNGGDWNLYRYVRANPVKYIDPDGHQFVGVGRDPKSINSPCKPVVYNCTRWGGAVRHAFFWIHWPCKPSQDISVSYGPPGGYKSHPGFPIGPGEDDDMSSIHSGNAQCNRTNCSPECVISYGDQIYPGGPWDPHDFDYVGGFIYYYLQIGRLGDPPKVCWGFNDYVHGKCGCQDTGPGFTPNRPNPVTLPGYNPGAYYVP